MTELPSTEGTNRMPAVAVTASEEASELRVGTGFTPAPVEETPTATRPTRAWMEPRPQLDPVKSEPQIPENVRQAVENIETRLQQEQGGAARRGVNR